MFGTELEFKRGEHQDPCSGDSGGPLMHLTPDSDSRRWVIIGWLEYKYKNKCDSMFWDVGALWYVLLPFCVLQLQCRCATHCTVNLLQVSSAFMSGFLETLVALFFLLLHLFVCCVL